MAIPGMSDNIGSGSDDWVVFVEYGCCDVDDCWLFDAGVQLITELEGARRFVKSHVDHAASNRLRVRAR
jgi:hypothetical protein